MSVAKKRGSSQRGGSTRKQATRRRSGEGTHEEAAQSREGAVPTRTTSRTYMQRGFSGYHRPKRPKRKGRYGVKGWTAADPLPGVTRPQGTEISQSQQKGQSAAAVVTKVKMHGGSHRSKRRGGR